MSKLIGLFLALALALVALPAHSQGYVRILDQNGVPVSSTNPLPTGNAATGNTAANMTSFSSAMTTSAETLTFTAAASHVTLTLSSGSSDLYIAFTGTAGTGNYILPGGFTFVYFGTALADLRVKGVGSTGTKSLIAY